MSSEPLTYKTIDPKVRKFAMIGLALGMLAACMDGTIVGTCANVITKELDGQELYSWIVTMYLLCESAMVPIAGKMSDRFGRKPVFLSGLVLFAIGSVGSGLSDSMMMLICMRGVQGLGGGILVPVAMASVADFYEPENRGKVQGAFGAVFGIGSGIGPLVGGALCEYLSWNWIFFVNIPIIVVCLVLTIRKFPEPVAQDRKRIDYLGIAVQTLLILDVLLYFQWISGDMEFVSAKSFGMIVAAVVLVAVFWTIERRAEDPVLAPKLFRNGLTVRSFVYMFIMGLAMIGTLTYIAMYIQQIYDIGTMECGLCLLPMVFGMMFTSMGSGMFVNRTGYRPWIITGSVLIMGTLLLMSTLGSDSARWIVLVYLFLFGLGLGCVNSTVMILVQNHTAHEDMGMTTSAISLMRNIGATVGTATYSLIISSRMNTEFAKTEFASLADALNLHGTGLISLRYFPPIPGLASTIVEIFGNAVCAAFLFGGILYIIALGLSFLMPKEYTVSADPVTDDGKE